MYNNFSMKVKRRAELLHCTQCTNVYRFASKSNDLPKIVSGENPFLVFLREKKKRNQDQIHIGELVVCGVLYLAPAALQGGVRELGKKTRAFSLLLHPTLEPQ